MITVGDMEGSYMEQTVLGNIQSQPEVLQRVFAERATFVDPFVREIREYQIRKIIFFGSGTSYNVSQIAAYYFKHLAHLPAEAQYPTVFKYYEQPDWTGFIDPGQILFVGISQSGTSVSTCEVMEYGKQLGCRTLVITGDLESRITQFADTVTHLLVGPELTPPETKGYTVSVFSVYLWALATAHELGALPAEEYDELITEAGDFVADFQHVLDEAKGWYERNKTSILQSDRLFVLGYGVDYGSMLEAMLKVGEMLRIPTIGFEIEEFSHGPTMGLRPNQTIFMIGSDEAEFDRMLVFRDAYKRYTPRVHVVSMRDLPDADGRDLVFSHRVSKCLAPLAYTVPFQFVAAQGAKDIYIDTAVNPFQESLAHYADEG